MNPTSKRLSSLLLALLLVLNLGAALAQEARQSEEEQGFFGDLWHYVERLPLAMENDEEAYSKRIKFIKDIYADKYRSFAEEDEEQRLWSNIGSKDFYNTKYYNVAEEDEEQGLWGKIGRTIGNSLHATKVFLTDLKDAPLEWADRVVDRWSDKIAEDEARKRR